MRSRYRLLGAVAFSVALAAGVSNAEIIYRATGHAVERTKPPSEAPKALSFSIEGDVEIAYGAEWNLRFSADGGTAPYVFSTEGFPDGLTFTESGPVLTVSGIASEGSHGIARVVVRDAAGAELSREVATIVAAPEAPLVLAGGSSRVMTPTDVYDTVLSVTGGLGPYEFVRPAGLPEAFSFVPEEDRVRISGSAPVGLHGPYRVGVRDRGRSFSAGPEFSIRVVNPPEIQAPATASLGRTVGEAWSVVSGVTGGFGTRSYSISPALPAGVTLNTATGEVAGTPSSPATGTFGPYRLTLSDGVRSGVVGPQFSVSVLPTLAVATPSGAPLALDNDTAWSIQISSTGGRGAKTYSMGGARALPSGVTLNATTGLISGKPTQQPTGQAHARPSGTFGPYQVVVRDDSNPTGVSTAQFSVVVLPGLGVTTPSGPALALANDSTWSIQVAASGGRGAKTYSMGGSGTRPLPAGVTLNATTGLISGKPTQQPTGHAFPYPGGTFGPYQVTVKDDSNATGVSTAQFSVVVAEFAPTHSGWGGNQSGELGLGTDGLQTTPTGLRERYLEVSAGGQFVCGVRTDETIWCSGFNGSGQLGSTTPSRSLVPSRVPGTGFVDVSSGGFHACGRKADSSVWCWGGSTRGQAGTRLGVSATPVQITGSFTDVVAGVNNTCGLKAGGTLWCWGSNSNKEISASTETAFTVPQQIAGTYSRVSVGNSICAISSSNGVLRCWGANIGGSVGNGTNTPVPASAPVTISGSWKDVSVGNDHTCAVSTDSTVSCWGAAVLGRLGLEGTGIRYPVRIPGLTDVATVHSRLFNCALKTNGQAWCWGINSLGQLGRGDVTSVELTPTRAGTELYRDLSVGVAVGVAKRR